jgi:hypothetical protein
MNVVRTGSSFSTRELTQKSSTPASTFSLTRIPASMRRLLLRWKTPSLSQVAQLALAPENPPPTTIQTREPLRAGAAAGGGASCALALTGAIPTIAAETTQAATSALIIDPTRERGGIVGIRRAGRSWGER